MPCISKWFVDCGVQKKQILWRKRYRFAQDDTFMQEINDSGD